MPGRSGRAEGEILNVMGRMLNLKGELVRNAKVEGLAGQRSWALHASEREAARLAGAHQRMQGLLAEKNILLRGMYGWRTP
jgi:hypothetical protein